MNAETKVGLAVIATTLAVTLIITSYNVYTNEKNREAYMHCLKLTEELIKADSKRLSTPYCRL